MRILVVEDEIDIADHIVDALTEQRYDVDRAENGAKALDRVFDGAYDLVLLDIMLPVLDGFKVLEEMRRGGIRTPVIMLTARNSLEDRVSGLDMGADDYLAKPFSIAELLARVRSVLRRAGENRDSLLTAGSVTLDTVTRMVTRDGAPLDLTAKEFSILEFLLYNKGRVVSRFNLAEHVWGDDYDPFTMSNFIDVHMKNLRRKIEDRDRIRTVRGIGYIIE